MSVTDRGQRLLTAVSGHAPTELYGRTDDPGERRDLAAAKPDDAKRLRVLVDGYAKQSAPPWGASPREVELDELRLNHLRALGYVVEP